MKRSIFFVVSALMVVLLLAAWVYILFFSTPSDDGSFVDFPNGEPGFTVPDQDQPTDGPVIDLTSPDRLRQLTLDPVIGFQEVLATPSSTPQIYYATAGRGHVFAIDTETGIEERISGATIAAARQSAITPNGAYILTQAGRGANSAFFISPLDTGASNAPLSLIPEDIISFSATTDNTFLFATKEGNGLVAKEYVPASSTSQTLFTIPFQEATIQWGASAPDTHFVYPKTTTQLEGYLYVSQSAKPLKRIMPGGFGFSAIGNMTYVLYAKQARGSYQSSVYNQFTREIYSLPISQIPQKCVPLSAQNLMLCASSVNKHTLRTPDDWHEGTISFSDTLFEVNLRTGGMTAISNTLEESGRELDIINPIAGTQDATIYFQNKNDQTLWLFDRTAQ